MKLPPLSFASLAAASLLAGGCATLRLIVYRPPHLAKCPGALAASGDIDGEFLRHLQIQVSAPEVDTGYQLVVQKKADRLVLVGLTRFGARAFSVVQEGATLQIDSALGPAAAVPPENILRDVHRAFFLRAGVPIASGEIEATRNGESIRETWRDGVLQRRVFSAAAGEVDLEFEGATRVRIHNRRCGYEATLVDVSAGDPAAGAGMRQ